MEMDEPSQSRSVAGRGNTALSWLASVIISTSIILLALVVWAYAYFGSIQIAIRSVSGQPLAVDATTKSFGVARPGERVEVSFRLTNHGTRPIRIVGSK